MQHTPSETNRLIQRYENEAGNERITRVWVKAGQKIHRTDREVMYNYTTETWDVTHTFTRTYDLADDGVTLVGDGSGWAGSGRPWTAHAETRHRTLLRKRFPRDEVEKRLAEQAS